MKTDMRVAITKQLLKQGLLRMNTPVMILREIAYDYASQLKEVFDSTLREERDIETGVEACLQYLLGRKEEIGLLLSENTENYIRKTPKEIVGILKKTFGDRAFL